MAFTREELQAYIDDGIDSPTAYSCGTVRELCRALLAEMDKPKVWDGAPEEADHVWLVYSVKSFDNGSLKEYGFARDLPKSRAREIAEEERARARESSGSLIDIADYVESGILKREKELEAGK
jgi:hypothetical protein